MTAKATPEATAEVRYLAAPRHKWRDAGTRLRDTTPSGCDEHERVCEFCGLAKITVHGAEGYPYRAWRTKGGVRFSDPGLTPMCEGVGTAPHHEKLAL